MSAQKRRQAIKKGTLLSKLKPHPQFKMYEFFIDKYADDKAQAQKQLEKYKLDLSNAGNTLKPT